MRLTLVLRPLAGFIALTLIGSGLAASQTYTNEDAVVVSGNPEFNGQFGFDVDTSGDVFVAGAYRENGGRGRAYVFRRTPAGWTLEATLESQDSNVFDGFGWSVAVDGDVIVVGAFSETASANDSGAAYVYRFDGQAWNLEEKIVPPGLSGGAKFGSSVEVEGDVLAASALGEPASTNQGRVYVYRFNGALWINEATLAPEHNMISPQDYGLDISLLGSTLAVGAPRGPLPGYVMGGVYVYSESGGVWSQSQLIFPQPLLNVGDLFGHSIVLDGSRLIIGAPHDDDTGQDAGAAYLYQLQAGQYELEQKLLPSIGADPFDDSGQDVHMSNGVIALTSTTDEIFESGGAVTLFEHNGTEWAETAILTASDTTPAHDFGWSIGFEENLVIGAISDASGLQSSGQIYVFEFTTDADGDGLTDDDEVNVYGTDPNNPDTDGDALQDGTEVLMAAGNACPSPLDADSDDDTLLDGQEVALGTSPCNPDSDEDGVSDAVDPTPTSPGVPEGWIEDRLRDDAEIIGNLPLELFDARNANQARGQRNVLEGLTRLAGIAVRFDADWVARIALSIVRNRVDGVEPPRDWMIASPERDALLQELDMARGLLQ